MDEKKEGSSIGAVGAGAAAGGLLGAQIGIAGFFGAISGVVPLAILGGYVGHKIYKAVTGSSDGGARTGKSEPSAVQSFVAGVSEGYREGQEATRKAERLRKQRAAILSKGPALEVPKLPPRQKKPKPPEQQ